MVPGHDRKVAEVWSRLARVTDPELDESVTELGFVTTVTVDEEDRVHVDFRLPTYWCAANFAFMMADDMHRAIQGLPWINSIEVDLEDHVYAGKINRGIAGGSVVQGDFCRGSRGRSGRDSRDLSPQGVSAAPGSRD